MKNEIEAKVLRQMIISGANNLQNNKDLVDKLNVFPVPDGDTGTNMSLTIRSAIKELDKLQEDNINITSIGKAISRGSLMGARGNSGVILSQIIRGISLGIENKDMLSVEDFAKALKLGSDTAYKAVIKPIEGTILTVIRETSEYALEESKKENDMIEFLDSIVEEANISLERTPLLLKTLNEAGVVDSGGKGLVLFFEGMIESLKGNFIEIEENADRKNALLNTIQIKSEDIEYVDSSNIKFGYCTEFILETDKITTIEIRDLLLPLGDSLAVVGDEGIIKIHIHTNEPGTVIQIALKYGQLITVKIENMRLQHENLLIENENVEKQVEEEKELGVIVTSVGDGISNLFKDLRADYIIKGGQTMNPSTQDFMDAIEKVNARNILIFPNNSNIIMSANQAKELSDRNVVVIPTKTVPQCVSALINLNEDASIEENERVMLEAIKNVCSGQITYAVKDVNIDGVEVSKDSYIGIVDGKMSSSNIDLNTVVLETLDKIFESKEDDGCLVTLYYGEDISSKDALLLGEEIASKYEDVDIEMVYGGQPIYYYLLSVE